MTRPLVFTCVFGLVTTGPLARADTPPSPPAAPPDRPALDPLPDGGGTTPPEGAGAADVEAGLSAEVIEVADVVVVEPSRLLGEPRTTPKTVNEVSAAQLRARGIGDFVGAMHTVPGVAPSLRYGGFDHLTIRGFGGGDFLVLNDGFRDERGPMVGGEVPIGPMTGLDRIEVLKGPAALQYGPNALGGAINLIRKQPTAEPTYELGVGLGNYADRRAWLGVGGALRRGLTFRVDANSLAQRNFRGATEQQAGAVGTARLALARGHVLDVRGGWISSDYGTDAGLPTVDGVVPASLPTTLRLNSPFDYLRYRSTDATASYVGRLSRAWSLQVRAQLQRLRQDYFSTEVVGVAPETPTQIDRAFFRFDHRMTIGLGQVELHGRGRLGVDHHLRIGYDGSAVRFRSPQAFADAAPVPIDDPRESQGAPDVPFSRKNYRDQAVHGLHVADLLTFGAWRVVVGGRLDVYDVTRRRDTLDPATGEVTMRGADVELRSLAPALDLGVVWSGPAGVTPYGSFTTSSRPQAPSVLPEGMEDLAPERARQVELGARLALAPRVLVHAAGYRIDKANILVARPNMQVDQAGAARSVGAELGLTAELGGLAVQGGYALTRARFIDYVEDDVDYSGKRLPDVPVHTLTAWATYLAGRGVVLGAGGRLIDRAFADRANTVVMPAYLVVDASAAWTRGPWTVALAARNLLDRNPLADDGRYFVSTIYDTQLTPGAPRTVLVSVTYGR